MNVQIYVLILLGYLQPVYLGNQRHLILALGHHQHSSQTTFASYVYFDKQECLSFSHDSLSIS